MPDDLWISGGGSSSVATDELYEAVEQLGRLVAEACGLSANLAMVDDVARCSLGTARALLDGVASQSRALTWALTTSAENYGTAERLLGLLASGLFGGAAGSFGWLVPQLGGTLLPLAASAFAGGLDASDISTILTRELAADAVRAGSMIADDLMLSAVGVPAPLTAVLGDEGLGLTGLPFAAGVIVAGGSLVGVFRETPVALAATTQLRPQSAPDGFEERFNRIPDSSELDGAQVVIDKYEVPGGEDRFEVYIGGTVTFDPVATSEPWDMTSNMTNAVGAGSGSYDSVALAMREAGITADSPVQFTGYSQGGGTAAQLVASGDYNSQGLITFGGPTGQVDLPESVPTVIVEHRDDIVPALGGTQQNQHAVIVERDAFGGHDIPEDELFPAHRRGPYEQTASLMDDAHDERLTHAVRQFDSFAPPGATVTSTAYRFERVSG